MPNWIRPPIFAPAVVDTYRGMLMEISLDDHECSSNSRDILEVYRRHYADSHLVCPVPPEKSANLPALTIERCANTDRIDLFVFAHPDSGQLRLCATLDNLGKGAAGSAVQNLNIMAGFDDEAGLTIISDM